MAKITRLEARHRLAFRPDEETSRILAQFVPFHPTAPDPLPELVSDWSATVGAAPDSLEERVRTLGSGRRLEIANGWEMENDTTGTLRLRLIVAIGTRAFQFANFLEENNIGEPAISHEGSRDKPLRLVPVYYDVDTHKLLDEGSMTLRQFAQRMLVTERDARARVVDAHVVVERRYGR